MQYSVDGLDCAEEVSVLRRVLEPLAGVEAVDFDVLRGRMTVRFDPGRVAEAHLREAVATTGMVAVPFRPGTRERPPRERLRTLLTALSGAAVVGGLVWHLVEGGGLGALGERPAPVAIVIYALAVVAGGWFVAPRAWSAARRLRPDMNLLMVVAVLGAVALGDWFEAGTVSFLFALSLRLEAWSVGRARAAVTALMDLSPARATVLDANGGERRVAAEDVPVGARVLVKPGERLPLDGRVVSGLSAVDQAPITGESVPVAKETGEEVFAGTINGAGALEIETSRPAGETTLARIIKLVDEAQARRSSSEQFVERFARVYTPVVMIVAIGTWIVPPLLFGQAWEPWLYNALVLLVIACPCALVISTPVSIVSGLTAAARRGVLVKGGRDMETPARLACLALDKTGTVTEGRPVVDKLLPLDEHSEEDLLAVAAAIEARSEHPLAAAIVAKAHEQGVDVVPAEDVTSLAGQGASAVVDGRAFWIGSHRYLEHRGQETPAVHDTLEALEADGHTVVVLGNDDHVCGLITLRDAPRPEAADAIAALHALGIERVVMLTGDNAGTATVIGRQVGIGDVRAELLPEDKLARIEELLEQHGEVAMVGDGVNDAPALARASLGIAMGAAGTDAAIETADIVIMSDDLSRLAWLVRHSQRTVAIIRQNIAASLAIKGLFIVLAFGGWSTLWGAIAADMGVSLAVVSNALRLLRDGEPG